MDHLMDQRLDHHGRHCQSKARRSRPRHLHQSTVNLGDAAPCYTTTQSQSYSGKSADGRPLIFHLRDPCFPSQHRTQLDLSTYSPPLPCPPQSHTNEAPGPERSAPTTDPKVENWVRHRSGQAVREIINPQNPPELWTTYRTDHTLPVTDGLPHQAGGTPTQWHQHNILTGELGQVADPGKPRRRSRDKQLWAARRRETDYSALRLY